MSDFILKMKAFLSRCVRFIRSTARGIVRSVKFKLNEIKHMSIRRDMIRDLGHQAYRLNQKGVTLPEELAQSLRRIEALEQELDELRSAYNAQKLEDAIERAAEKVSRTAKYTASRAAVYPEDAVPVAETAQTGGDQPEAEAAFPQVPTMDFPAEESCTAEAAAEEDVPTLAR